jgi:hypothetical protein
VSHRTATPGSPLHVTPETLGGAPELAVLALLDENLRIAALSLLAAQPALVGEPPSWRVTSELIAAARLLRDARKLERSIARYRRCVLQMLRDEPERDDDLPF